MLSEDEMTKEQYVEWKQNRDPDPANWDPALCREADALIKHITLINLAEYLEDKGVPWFVITWAKSAASYTFGSIETDQLFIQTNCYPAWK